MSSLTHKKLLNLTHDWLRTFLPHCLAKAPFCCLWPGSLESFGWCRVESSILARSGKPHLLGQVNRVSFGLLNEDDCKQALADDPHCPPSRLKLAVPFVGKDVPSMISPLSPLVPPSSYHEASPPKKTRRISPPGLPGTDMTPSRPNQIAARATVVWLAQLLLFLGPTRVQLWPWSHQRFLGGPSP